MSNIIDDAKTYVENEILVNKEDQPQEIISKYAIYSSGLGIFLRIFFLRLIGLSGL
ncbi:MAG: hypothetical protein IPN72_17555 [Saprospiraceae bacterium]|nr:hypothetical protein [Saprospiraceae bacterium]